MEIEVKHEMTASTILLKLLCQTVGNLESPMCGTMSAFYANV